MVGKEGLPVARIGPYLQPCTTPHRGDLMIASTGIRYPFGAGDSHSLRDLAPDDIGYRPASHSRSSALHSIFTQAGPTKPLASSNRLTVT